MRKTFSLVTGKLLTCTIIITLSSLVIIEGCKKKEVLPVACFNLSNTNVVAGDTILFNNCSQNATQYFWDFGDGNTSSEQNPKHTFPFLLGDTATHVYTVKLTAFNGSNNNIFQQDISVLPSAVRDTLVDTTYIETTIQAGEIKNVVIELFSGVRVPNGATANQTIADLKTLHAGRIIPVCLHPINSLGAPYSFSQEDFRNAKSQDLFDFVGQVGFEPVAGIDRNLFAGESAILLAESKWATRVLEQLNQTSPVNILLYSLYDSVANSTTIIVELHYTQPVLTSNKLSVLIKESNIPNPQLNGSVIDTFYSHQDIMRDFITDTHGDWISSSAETGRVIRKIYKNVLLNPSWNLEDLKIVAFVHNFQNDKLIYTAKEIKVH